MNKTSEQESKSFTSAVPKPEHLDVISPVDPCESAGLEPTTPIIDIEGVGLINLMAVTFIEHSASNQGQYKVLISGVEVKVNEKNFAREDFAKMVKELY